MKKLSNIISKFVQSFINASLYVGIISMTVLGGHFLVTRVINIFDISKTPFERVFSALVFICAMVTGYNSKTSYTYNNSTYRIEAKEGNEDETK